MKHLAVIAALLLCGAASARHREPEKLSAPHVNPNPPISGKIVAASNNVPTAFDTTAGSLVVSATGGLGYTHLACDNETSARIAVIMAQGTTAPSSSSTAKIYIPANNFRIWDEVTILDRVYVESDSGSALSSGTIECGVW